MPVARFQMPDGRIGRFEVPEGTTPEQAQQLITQHVSQPTQPDTFLGMDTGKLQAVGQGVKDAAGGFARSGMGLVSNLMRPIDAITGANDPTLSSLITGNKPQTANEKRMALIDQRFRNEYGVNPDSAAFQAAKLGGDIAATAPIGGFLGSGVKALSKAPAATAFANALASGGMTTGNKLVDASLAARALDMGTRVAGGAVTGAATTGAIDPNSAGTGALIGGAMPGAVKVAGDAGAMLSDKVIKPVANRLMQSAIKPTIEQLRNGDAKTAIDMLLKYGISPTAKGVDKLRTMIDDINTSIQNKIAGSDATVGRNDVLSYLGEVRGKFGNQVNPASDLSAIENVGNEFANHPYFQAAEAHGQQLKSDLERATLGKVQALQASGKLKTMEAQQSNLAHGGSIGLSPNQTENTIYFNAGKTGRSIVSPSAYPTPLAPRFPGRYTPNIDRVPEAKSGYQDAMSAYAQRKADEQAAAQAYEKWQSTNGSLPVQQAQALKQGTYKALAGKYGEVGSASTEAQKALARGLKDKIAEAVPGVGQLNAEESRLLSTLSVTERRALMEMNKNPLGLSALAGSKQALATFMADRSAAFKSLAARMINRSAAAPASIGLLSNRLENPMLRNAWLLSVQSNQ